ncbi:MAG: HAMP domain-containing sensor histidine kinase, partial [Caldimonas sp.]
RVVNTFKLFAELIALQLDNERSHDRARAELLDEQRTGELREQFIAVLGHDLRNPLAAIAACSQLLQRKAGDAAMIATLGGRIETNVRRMSILIDDVLDFARGRLGSGIVVHAELVSDLDEALAAVVTELRDGHPARLIEAAIEVRRPVRCDRSRIQQLVSNLLANALVHGAQDRPVRVRAGIDAEALVIEVWNAGEPIPPASIDRIFAPFWRHSTSARREGLGLGLHISEQIVKAHGGTLTVSSGHDEGTRFSASLPLDAATPTAA